MQFLFLKHMHMVLTMIWAVSNIWEGLTSLYYFFSYSAARTKNYSGAELEGVVKSAVSFALNRQVSMDDLTKPVDEENIKVTMDDFLNALLEIVPAFGASTDDLERCRWFFWFKLVQILVLWLQDVNLHSAWILIILMF